MKDIANFLFEVGMLARTPRGFSSLMIGSPEQSVADHNNRVIFIGYTLAMLEKDVDVSKILKMCLLHDVTECRISDLNYVHQKYAERKEKEALEDLAQTLPFGDDMKNVIQEFEEKKTKESLLAKDADGLEWLLNLKEGCDMGNKRMETYIPSAVARLKTDIAKKLAKQILETDSDDWWFGDKDDDWWVTRTRK